MQVNVNGKVRKMIVVTGATGHVGSKLAHMLLDAGQKVRVISRHADKMQPLVDKGAEAATGSLDNTTFLTNAFEGADVVFAMIPTDAKAADVRAYQNKIGESIATAIQHSHVKNVVNVSSIGTHLHEHGGIVQGLYDQEQRLNRLNAINVVHLRPSYFMENLFMQIDLIKSSGIVGSAIKGDIKFPIVATRDIAEISVPYLTKLHFSGSQVRYLLGPRDVDFEEITRVLSKAVGKEGVKYVQFPYEEAARGMLQFGASESTANAMVEFQKGMNEGPVLADYKRTPESTTRTSIEDFAGEFAEAYRGIAAASR